MAAGSTLTSTWGEQYKLRSEKDRMVSGFTGHSKDLRAIFSHFSVGRVPWNPWIHIITVASFFLTPTSFSSVLSSFPWTQKYGNLLVPDGRERTDGRRWKWITCLEEASHKSRMQCGECGVLKITLALSLLSDVPVLLCWFYRLSAEE